MRCECAGSVYRCIWTAALISASAFAGLSAEKLTFSREARVNWEYAGRTIPKWSGGYLIPIVNNGMAAPVIHFIDEWGKEAEPLRFTIPDARSALIDDVGRAPDGTWVLSGRAHDYQGKGGGFITWISPNRQNITTVQLYPYNAIRLAVGTDGTTWTEGAEIIGGNDWTGSDHGFIRRFDKFGKLMGWWIPRNSVPEVHTYDMDAGKLATGADRLEFYAGPAHQFFELSYAGNKVSRFVSYPGVGTPGDQNMYVTGMAILDNADVYLSVQNQNAHTDQIYVLDRTHRTWQPVPPPNLPNGLPIEHPAIYGADGKRLAFYNGPDSILFVTPGGEGNQS